MRNGAELVLNKLERPPRVELAGDHQHRIVWLVVLTVEGLQPLDRHVFDVGPCANRGVPIVVPEERRRQGPLEQHVKGKVLAGLEFVADHRHFGLKVLLGNEAVDHAIGFQVERPVQVFSARRERFEIVGPIERRRPIGPRPVLGELLRNVPMLGCTLENHVLEEVGHPGLAVPFITRSYQKSHVDSRRRLR